MPNLPGFYSLFNGKQVQQNHRFILRIKNIDAALIQSVTVPKLTVSTNSYRLLEYNFNYPTKLDWGNQITFDILQVLDKDANVTILGYIMSLIYNKDFFASPLEINAGEKNPLLPNSYYTTKDQVTNLLGSISNVGYTRGFTESSVLDLSKQKLASALGNVEIRLINEDGENIESWILNGAFISGINPTDLSYMNETISTIKVTLTYDWAEYVLGNGNGAPNTITTRNLIELSEYQKGK